MLVVTSGDAVYIEGILGMLTYEDHSMEIVFMDDYVWTVDTSDRPSDEDIPWGKMY